MKPEQTEGDFGQQASADPSSLQIISDVKILEEGSPFRVLVQHGVSETDYITKAIGNDRALIR